MVDRAKLEENVNRRWEWLAQEARKHPKRLLTIFGLILIGTNWLSAWVF
jgi:hypothetical protein